MRLLILGGDGMIGHQLLKHFADKHETRVTLRQDLTAYSRYNLFDTSNAYEAVDVRDFSRVTKVLADFRPHALINAVGMVKQRHEPQLELLSIEINSMLPHRLASLCGAAGVRLVHFSTDCVFSGRRGNYTELDMPDPEDLYGRTKLLGEVSEPNCITLRTSIIGRELNRKTGLLEWALAQHGSISGYVNAIYSGFTTIEMSRIVEKLLVQHPEASGVCHVSSDPISKYDLLMLIKNKLHLPIDVRPDEEFKCDRSLNSFRFRDKFDYTPPSWDAMIDELSKTQGSHDI